MVVVTGIKPTGTVHLGNYLGAIRPALALADEAERALLFIADYHALTSVRDPEELRRATRAVAASFLALGLDPGRVVFYRQSDVPAICELAWILACITPKGLMSRAHAYKAAHAIDPSDAGVEMGLYSYPILMAADVLLFCAELVPVGKDQVQHVEIARDLAGRFNRAFGEVLVAPAARVGVSAQVVGFDGRKMSKSNDNGIPIFAPQRVIERLVRRYVTDSSGPSDPKDPGASPLYAIYHELASPEESAALARRFAEGIGWGEVKALVAERIVATFAEPRRRYEALLAEPERIEATLRAGGERARALAAPAMERIRQAVGLAG